MSAQPPPRRKWTVEEIDSTIEFIRKKRLGLLEEVAELEKADSELGAAGNVLLALIMELYPEVDRFAQIFLQVQVRQRLRSQLGINIKRG